MLFGVLALLLVPGAAQVSVSPRSLPSARPLPLSFPVSTTQEIGFPTRDGLSLGISLDLDLRLDLDLGPILDQGGTAPLPLTQGIRLQRTLARRASARRRSDGALHRFFDGRSGKKTSWKPALAASGRTPGPDSTFQGFSQRRLDEIPELRIGTYNVLNLFEHVGKWVKGLMVKPPNTKDRKHLSGQAKAILESDLDIIVLQEVENVAALRNFSRDYLGDQYVPLLVEGNDGRGIDIGFLVKKDLPFEIDHRSHKDETWKDPTAGNKVKTLFSRDLPVLVVRAPGREEPLFLFMGTHFKSKRTRNRRDPESGILRRAQAERAAEIVGRFRHEFGQEVPILFAGDFNGNVPTDPNLEKLVHKTELLDVFNLVTPPVPLKDRITHTYHPRGKKTVYQQLDAILVSKALAPLIAAAEVYRYRDASGSLIPIPDTYEKRKKNPSDHFPVIMTFKFQPLLARFFGPRAAQSAIGRREASELP